MVTVTATGAGMVAGTGTVTGITIIITGDTATEVGEQQLT
jgi:hypothetical protein